MVDVDLVKSFVGKIIKNPIKAGIAAFLIYKILNNVEKKDVKEFKKERLDMLYESVVLNGK